MGVGIARSPAASRRRARRVDSPGRALVTYPRMSYIVVVTTVGNEEQANLIAEEVVARRHAGCVNIIPGIRSLYRWQGKICRDSEIARMGLAYVITHGVRGRRISALIVGTP